MSITRQIRITAASISALGEINDTRTGDVIWQALPLKARASLWGDEIYFAIPVKMDIESGQELVKLGELGYWPEGHSLCIFFGPTPVSSRGEIRAASAVNIIGKIVGDPKIFKGVKQGDRIIIEKADSR
jgi:hypothetical protein